MEYDTIVIELKDGEVVLYLAQPVGETEYLTATLYKQGTLLSQHKINEIEELINILKKFEVIRWT